MRDLPRYLAAIFSIGAGLGVFVANSAKGAATPFRIVGAAPSIAARILVARGRASNSATRTTRLVGALGPS